MKHPRQAIHGKGKLAAGSKHTERREIGVLKLDVRQAASRALGDRRVLLAPEEARPGRKPVAVDQMLVPVLDAIPLAIQAGAQRIILAVRHDRSVPDIVGVARHEIPGHQEIALAFKRECHRPGLQTRHSGHSRVVRYTGGRRARCAVDRPGRPPGGSERPSGPSGGPGEPETPEHRPRPPGGSRRSRGRLQ
ncbi:hypothetical protein COLO4_00850 [Corchorus olitorius]|uniref:Uncharacterized protein n=1 Tax=Corchorus olitorius TaxID=93759 RepID=A0A1R3L3B6_9ROSI|nr:hypothetical protein COLO4_00850 [Corchorus olitorius]